MDDVDSKRRGFLRMGLIAAVACGISTPALARVIVPSRKGKRTLSLHNLHTDEKLQVTYWKDGSYDRRAWAQINHILRDHYSGDTRVINLNLIDLVHDLQTYLGNDNAIEIISGYRSPKTNRHLIEAGTGVARRSYHMRGMAIDLRINGTPLPELKETALTIGRGGVGYYPKSQFVHVDVGPVRRWG